MRYFVVIIILLIIFSSCANKSSNDLEVFKATIEGLKNSNKLIRVSSEILYRSLEEKTKDPRTAEQAMVWQPKATKIKEISLTMNSYIEKLIKELEEGAHIKTENGKTKINEDNIDVTTRLFKKEKGMELYEKLKKYKQDMLGIDPELNKVFGNNSIIITREFELDSSKQKDFTAIFFGNTGVVAALAMLNKFENNVWVMENEFLTFCFNKIGSTDRGGFVTNIRVIIGLSASIVKAGDMVTIDAGIGEFSMAPNPRININGIAIPLDDAVATYKFKTPLKAGKYSIPVTIDYIGPDGLKQRMTKKVEYTVVE